MHPAAGLATLSYHGDQKRWSTIDAETCCLSSVSKGQQFVLKTMQDDLLRGWLGGLFTDVDSGRIEHRPDLWRPLTWLERVDPRLLPRQAFVALGDADPVRDGSGQTPRQRSTPASRGPEASLPHFLTSPFLPPAPR